MKYIPLFGKIVLRLKEKKKGSFIIDDPNKTIVQGVVQAVGPGEYNIYKDKYEPIPVEGGNSVVFNKLDAIELTGDNDNDNDIVYVLNQHDIIAIVEN